MGDIFSSMHFLSSIHDGFMRMVYEIFHSMFERKKGRFCWCIHISTEAHCEILKIIASLGSDVNESTNPMIEGSSMCFLNLFRLLSNYKCSHEDCMPKRVICQKWRLLKFNLIFFQYYWMILFMMWYFWSMMMPYLLSIMLMLRSFRFDTSWKV